MDYPGSVFTPKLQFDPSLSTGRLQWSANAVRVEWWRAIPNPAYNKRAGSVPGVAGQEYLRVKQDGEYWVILGNSSQVLKRYFPQGDWPTGTVTIEYDAATLPLGLYDWLYPQNGTVPAPDGLAPAFDSRTYTEKMTVKRGSNSLPQNGTISTAGTAVTGAGTSFLSTYQIGDVLTAGDFAARVTAIADDTHLTLDAAPPVNLAGRSYGKGRDLLLYTPVARLSLVQDADRTYIIGTDVTLTPEGDGLQWLSATSSPPPGAVVSVIYDYLPRYEITDQGQRGALIGGKGLLSMTIASLWKPETTDH